MQMQKKKKKFNISSLSSAIIPLNNETERKNITTKITNVCSNKPINDDCESQYYDYDPNNLNPDISQIRNLFNQVFINSKTLKPITKISQKSVLNQTIKE